MIQGLFYIVVRKKTQKRIYFAVIATNILQRYCKTATDGTFQSIGSGGTLSEAVSAYSISFFAVLGNNPVSENQLSSR